MLELNGKFNMAKVYIDSVDSSTQGQIIAICNNELFKDSKIRIMPDCHAGKGCLVGTTISLTNFNTSVMNKIIPTYVGSDIGCGMLVIALKEKKIELPKFDSVVSKNVSNGESIYELDNLLDALKCKKYVYERKAISNMGTLGGGNHFIEIDKDSNDNLYLVIHSGSRSLGTDVCNFYMDEGKSEAHSFEDYLYDMQLTQQYASLNRQRIAKKILKSMKLHEICENSFETVHNYIDIKTMILRKGAVSAKQNEKLIIPINMRDGALICKGKGNCDWNESAPHGAGRLYSRSDVKGMVTLNDFKKSMVGVYTSSVGVSTIDECPMAYKDINVIMKNIKDTVDVIERLIPVYNFKQSE